MATRQVDTSLNDSYHVESTRVIWVLECQVQHTDYSNYYYDTCSSLQ